MTRRQENAWIIALSLAFCLTIAGGLLLARAIQPKPFVFVEPIAYCQATAGVVGGEYFDTEWFAPCRDVLREQDI